MKITNFLSNYFLNYQQLTNEQITDIFNFIVELERAESIHSLLSTIVESRKKTLLRNNPNFINDNLNKIFASKEYQNLIIEDSYLSPQSEHLLIEKFALKFFDSILKMWASYELHKVKSRCLGHCDERCSISLNEDEYTGQLVENISTTDLQVKTPYEPGVYSLKDAILVSNIHLFVLEQKWFELLDTLSLSAEGRHFVLLRLTDNYPILASSALVQDWSERHSWLSFSPFFQHDGWEMLVDKEQLAVVSQSKIFKSALKKYTSLRSFDKECSSLICNDDKACEILRLSTSGSTKQRLFILYLAQKQIAFVLSRSGFRLAYTIIDHTWLLFFYRALKPGNYIDVARYAINETNLFTYRGFWFVKNVAKSFEKQNFKSYSELVFRTKQEASPIYE
ncbi:acyl-homoserine-lactone synthase [Vibrio sp. TRT 21S02]|uniref:acyl-homoserine-lactone synthase n=1 Tax=Vibrio sp. TRT 21S02 TaxID=3418507 RepID=UPI003CFA19FB